MAITNHERVGKALELLKAGLAPFFEREIKNVYQAEATRLLASTAGNLSPTGMLRPSSTNVMWEGWNEVFRRTLGPAERSLVSELRDHRNKCAHQHSFSGARCLPCARLGRSPVDRRLRAAGRGRRAGPKASASQSR